MKTANFLLCLVAIVISSVNGSPAGDIRNDNGSEIPISEIASPSDDGRIVNGFSIPISKIPYMVYIKQDTGVYCGGSLIERDTVLTAAHCIYGKHESQITVYANTTSVYETGISRNVTKMSYHWDYSPLTRHSDVAVLKLDREVEGMGTLELCRQSLKANDTVQVSGWGRLGEGKSSSTTLQTVFLPVRSQDVCVQEFGSLVDHNMFCVSGVDDKSACRGDSGGPAVFEGQVCGLVAFGSLCGVKGYPSAYTDVFKVLPFIKQFLGQY